MIPALASCWLSAAELAARALPDMPETKKGILDRARKEGWLSRRTASGEPLARKRAGRGGGWEYHVGLLPVSAKQELSRRAFQPAPMPAISRPIEDPRYAARRRWFDSLGATAKDRAARSLSIVQMVELEMQAGRGKTAAVALVAIREGVSRSTINSWFAMIAGVSADRRLVYLAPAFRGGGRLASIDDNAWSILAGEWLRPDQPAFSACYEVVDRYARRHGLTLPNPRTLHRRLITVFGSRANVPLTIELVDRRGEAAVRDALATLDTAARRALLAALLTEELGA